MRHNNSKVILVIVVGFLALSFIFPSQKVVFTYISLGIGVFSLLSSTTENAIVWVWDKIALVLGWINTRIILSLVFFIFLTPIAILKKVFSAKDPMKLKNRHESTYVNRSHTYTKKDLENIW